MERLDRQAQSVKNTASKIAGAFAVQQLVQNIIKVRGEFQQLEVSFNTMLGSEEKASELMDQLIRTAATTPFDLQGIANGARQLLAYGENVENVNDDLIRLGNIAAGLNQPLNDLVYLFGTTMTQGRLYTQDYNQFVGRGIPLGRELANVLGVAESKLGIIVDTLVGQEEIVIKSMGDYLQNIQGIAGATIRGDGRVTLIIDVAAMMDMAKEIKVDIKAQIESSAKKPKEKPSDYKVLIVDDSKMDRTLMQKALEPLGVSLIEATNGVEALNIIKSGDHDIDAILIDIEMPRMDGYTLAGEIRKYSKYRNLPLIAVTSRTSKTDRLRGVEVGMTEYITKPYSPEYLENVVRKNLKLG